MQRVAASGRKWLGRRQLSQAAQPRGGRPEARPLREARPKFAAHKFTKVNTQRVRWIYVRKSDKTIWCEYDGRTWLHSTGQIGWLEVDAATADISDVGSEFSCWGRAATSDLESSKTSSD